jgi:hypothetical protein
MRGTGKAMRLGLRNEREMHNTDGQCADTAILDARQLCQPAQFMGNDLSDDSP